MEVVLKIAWEIGREGREGKPVSTAFVVGDSENVLANSKQLIHNPVESMKPEDRMITNSEFNGTIKEFAQLDGIFVIRRDGVVKAACRFLTADASSVNIPKGHGTKHSSVAAITMVARAVGIVVSQSGGRITIFTDGRIVKSLS